MRRTICIVAVLAATTTTLLAQTNLQKEKAPESRPDGRVNTFAAPGAEQSALLEKHFFAPELIMQHQHAIGLTANQQAAIRSEMQQSMAQFTDLQWRESAQVESLTGILKQDQPNEKEALTELDKLLDLENQIKRLRTAMLIRIKSLLTPEQQAQLRGLKRIGGPQPKVLW
jgi:Spy/CpxP family protein refolding chaperone